MKPNVWVGMATGMKMILHWKRSLIEGRKAEQCKPGTSDTTSPICRNKELEKRTSRIESQRARKKEIDYLPKARGRKGRNKTERSMSAVVVVVKRRSRLLSMANFYDEFLIPPHNQKCAITK